MTTTTTLVPLLLVVLIVGTIVQSGESFVTTTKPTTKATAPKTLTAAASATSFEDLRRGFPENANIVGAGGWNNLETLAKQQDPKTALVEFIADGLKGASSAIQPKSDNDKKSIQSINEKIEALSLILYGLGKGFSADAIDGEWDLVFTKQGSKSPSFQKIVGTKETAGKSKNIFDIKKMIFYGDVRFWKWGLVSTSVKYTPTSESFSIAPNGKIVVRKIVCTIVNAFFKWWKLPKINFPLPKKSGFLEVIYLDEDVRVTKGNRGGFFVHFRPNFLKQVMAA